MWKKKKSPKTSFFWLHDFLDKICTTTFVFLVKRPLIWYIGRPGLEKSFYGDRQTEIARPLYGLKEGRAEKRIIFSISMIICTGLVSSTVCSESAEILSSIQSISVSYRTTVRKISQGGSGFLGYTMGVYITRLESCQNLCIFILSLW
jgi:hypothetical protein